MASLISDSEAQSQARTMQQCVACCAC